MTDKLSNKQSGLLPYSLLVAVVAIVYGNTLFGGFVWDDRLFAANQVYWDFDLRKIFFSLANGLEYQPLRDLTFLFDIGVWGGSAFGFHFTGLLLFTAVVVLAYRVAESLSMLPGLADDNRSIWAVPLLTALVFAIHPLKSEVVAWITQRNTLLATLFLLASVLYFLRYLEKTEKRALALSIGAFFLAILAKATVVILPLLLLFLQFIKKGGDWRQRGFLSPVVPFIALSGVGAALHVGIAKKTAVISSQYFGTYQERVAVFLQIPFFYLKKSLVPLDISAFYTPQFALSLVSGRVLAAIVALAAMAAVAWLLRKRFPEIIIGGGWFFITLLPVSNLLATSPVAADRYLFLPSFGLAFTAAALVCRLRPPLKLLISIPLLILGFLTYKQNRIWHDEVSLWRQTSFYSPQVAGVWFNLGRALHSTPQLAAALEAYLRAHKLNPADMKSLDNAATLFPSTRGSIAARHELVKSLAEQLPPYPAGLTLIGYTDAPWQHPDAAEELFLYLLNADAQSLTLQLALANLYRKLGAFDRAVPIYSGIVNSGQGRGEAELGLASIAAASGNQQERARLTALAKAKGGIPVEILTKLK